MDLDYTSLSMSNATFPLFYKDLAACPNPLKKQIFVHSLPSAL